MTSASLPSALETVPIAQIKPYANNPRTHSKAQIRQVANSIREFGWTNPILIDAENGVIAGHGRLAAAKLLGMDRVPVLRLVHMTEAQTRAYIIADNQLALKAGWDEDLLALELGWLMENAPDLDIESTGFDTGEIDLLLEDEVSEDPAVELPKEDAVAVNRPGDSWIIGPHRLVCGNALDPAAYRSLLDGRLASMVFTDPPYNVPIDGHVSGKGAARHREFAMASGEMSSDAFTSFLRTTFERCVEASADGSIHYVCMDWRHMGEMLAAGEDCFSELKNLCVWGKTNAGMGTFYRSQHELVFVWKAGSKPHINNFGLGEHGRHRSNLWSYAGAKTFRDGRLEDLASHPTVKPIVLVKDAILDCSKRGDIVLDPFAGSGTTLLAAAETGRVGAGIEFDPLYADLILRRLQTATGEMAIHGESFYGFAEVAAHRQKEDAA